MSTPMKNFPEVSKALLEHLDQRFPDRCPTECMNDREIWMEVGARRVVQFLQSIYQEQNDTRMESSYNVH